MAPEQGLVFRNAIEGALRVLGGALATPGDRRRPLGILASAEHIAALPDADVEALRRHNRRVPVFLFAGDVEGATPAIAGAAFKRLTGRALELAEPRSATDYRFSRNGGTWPFAGARMSERLPRTVGAVTTTDPEIEPLVLTSAGAMFLKWSRGGRTVFFSLAPLRDIAAGRLLKEALCGDRFASVLPAMVFARAALGEAGWRTPTPRAAFIVDDPNLRFSRYGFLDYQTLVAGGREHRFHTAIAMIPLDYRKTRSTVAALMLSNREHLSLVMHGIHHTKHEFDRPIRQVAVEEMLAEGLRWMELHRQATGIAYPRAITFPHGRCNRTWMAGLRRLDFHAAIARRAAPFEPQEDIRDLLYEMHPAEMGFQGFPVVNRFRAEDPKENLLFAAWLGKPLLVYTHHGFFERGIEPLCEIADYLNQQVQPRWADIGSILGLNYQLRATSDGLGVRVFSNCASVLLDSGPRAFALLKPGADIPSDEAGWVNGTRLRPERIPGLGLVAEGIDASGDQLDIRFGPANPHVDARSPKSPPLWTRSRRLLTEARDRARGRSPRGRVHGRREH